MFKDYLKQKEVIKKTNVETPFCNAMAYLGFERQYPSTISATKPSVWLDKQRAQGQGIHVWTSVKYTVMHGNLYYGSSPSKRQISRTQSTSTLCRNELSYGYHQS